MKRAVLVILAFTLFVILAAVVLAGFLYTIAHWIARMAGIV